MIGDNHHRPLLRDTLEVGGIHLQINIHLAQQVFEDRMLASFAGSLVEVMNLLQRQELAGESRQSGKRGSMGEHTVWTESSRGDRMGMVTLLARQLFEIGRASCRERVSICMVWTAL